MTERQQISIKAKCKGVIRLLKIPEDVSYKAFNDLLKNSFGVSNFHLQYSDEEGDTPARPYCSYGACNHNIPSYCKSNNLVELGSQDELQEALKVGEKVSPLKITLITNENPTMSAMVNKPSDLVPSNTIEDELNVNLEGNTLVEPLSSMTINEKPTPKPRPNRKRIGFYTSLCSDISDVEKGKFSSGEDSQNGGRTKYDPKAGKGSKPKKEKRARGSQYYAMLADEVATMKLQEESEMKKNGNSKKKDTAVREMTKKRIPEEKVEKDSSEVCVSDEEPPKWFAKVVTKMSQSVSSQVLGALNGTVMVPTGTPTKAMRDGAAYVHNDITCDGCRQVIVGPRYKCGNCPNFDLCEPCEAIEDIHDPSHVFVKLRYPGVAIGRRHGVMIPLLKDLIYKSKDVELAEEQDKRMKEVRKKLKQLAKKKREEQIGKKKTDKKMKKLQKAGGANENLVNGYELALIGDGSYPDGTEVTPGFEFTKCWKIRNTGTRAWNDHTKLVYLYGGMRCLRSTEVGLPHLEPGQEGTVMITFVAPLDIGEYYSVWRAAYNERNFGSKIWCKIKVVCESVPSDNEDEIFVDANDVTVAAMQESFHEAINPGIFDQDSSLTQPGPIFHAYTTTEQNNETDAGEVSSTENQATFSDVSLLECNELEWDTCIVDNDTGLNEDDAPDIEVLSIASSDDFCVVPLPACFDPDIPLNFEDLGQGSSVVRPMSLAEEMDPSGSRADHQNMTADEEPETDEATAELVQVGNPENEHGSSMEDTIPDRPVSPEVDQSSEVDQSVSPEVVPPETPEGELPEQTTSVPINIEVKNVERGDWHPLMMPNFDARSTISEPVAPQPPSLERNPLFPGRLPGSPPGRAVPIVQISVSKPSVEGTDSGSYEVEITSDQGHRQTVRTQPPDVMVARQISEEDETVTIQPRGAVGMTSQSSNQSTAEFAQAFVTGTLKRAFGTVTDTVTSFMTGTDTPTTVIYAPNGSSDEVVNVQVNVPGVHGSSTGDMRSHMKQLNEMGFCDRRLNERLLKKHNMDVSKVVTELLHENDNNWSAARH